MSIQVYTVILFWEQMDRSGNKHMQDLEVLGSYTSLAAAKNFLMDYTMEKGLQIEIKKADLIYDISEAEISLKPENCWYARVEAYYSQVYVIVLN